MRPEIKMPFDLDGNLREYAGYGETEWRENVPFEAVLEVVGYERGRSAVRVIFRDEDLHKYPMFVSDLVEMLKTSMVIEGKVAGTWVGTKKGQNYGVKKVNQ